MKNIRGIFFAAILVPEGDGFADADVCRTLLDFSAEKRFPVIFAGDERKYRAAAALGPDALMYRADENKLLEALQIVRNRVSDAPADTVAVFSEESEYFAYCEEKAEESGVRGLRMIYCRAEEGAAERLAKRAVKPKLLIFCGKEAAAEKVKTAGFPGVPFVVLHCSDEPPHMGRLRPLAVIDVRSGRDELARCLAGIGGRNDTRSGHKRP